MTINYFYLALAIGGGLFLEFAVTLIVQYFLTRAAVRRTNKKVDESIGQLKDILSQRSLSSKDPFNFDNLKVN